MSKATRTPKSPLFDDASFAYWTQFFVGLVIAAWGAYFLGPWEPMQYSINPAQQYAAEIILGPIVSMFEVIVGVGIIMGAVLRNHNISRIFLIGTVIAYSLVVMLRIMTTGLFPFYWLFQLGLAFIAMLLMLRSGLNNDAD